MRALLDTSFFIAHESGRPLGAADHVTETEISMVTVSELTLGVLVASDATRSARVATLVNVEATWEPIPIDAAVARQFAHTASALKQEGRRIGLLDVMIAATAIVHDLPVVTQDSDFSLIPGLDVILV